jgi:hypothetical protein
MDPIFRSKASTVIAKTHVETLPQFRKRRRQVTTEEEDIRAGQEGLCRQHRARPGYKEVVTLRVFEPHGARGSRLHLQAVQVFRKIDQKNLIGKMGRDMQPRTQKKFIYVLRTRARLEGPDAAQDMNVLWR